MAGGWKFGNDDNAVKTVLLYKRLDLPLGTEMQHSFREHESGGATYFKSALVGG